MKYAIYARKSSESEDKQVVSIDSQIESLKDIVSQHKLDILEIYTEEKSAKKPGRQKFTHLMEEIEKGKIKGIIAWKLDRLARNARDGGWVIQLIDDNKLVEIVTPTRIYRNNGDDKFWMNLEFGMAKKFVDDLSLNTKRGLQYTLLQGRWIGAAPLGYINIDSEGRIAGKRYNKIKQRLLDDLNRPLLRIEPDPIDSKLIIQLFQKEAECNYTLMQLAKYSDSIGLKNVNGNKLGKSQVAYILHNKFYIGEMIVNGEIFKGEYTPLVDQVTFNIIQKHLSDTSKPRNINHNHLYKGLIKCAHCGCMITASTKIKLYKRKNKIASYTYYHCTGRKGGCGNKYITENELEMQIAECMKLIKLSKPLIEDGLNRIKSSHQEHLNAELHHRKLWTDELLTLESKLKKLLDLRIDGEIDENEYTKKKHELINSKAELQSRCDDSSNTSTNWLERMEEFLNACNLASVVFEKGTDEEKRNLVKSLGWNLFLKDGKLVWSYRKPYDSATNLPLSLIEADSEEAKNQIWLPSMDLNHNYRIQSAASYR